MQNCTCSIRWLKLGLCRHSPPGARSWCRVPLPSLCARHVCTASTIVGRRTYRISASCPWATLFRDTESGDFRLVPLPNSATQTVSDGVGSRQKCQHGCNNSLIVFFCMPGVRPLSLMSRFPDGHLSLAMVIGLWICVDFFVLPARPVSGETAATEIVRTEAVCIFISAGNRRSCNRSWSLLIACPVHRYTDAHPLRCF